jgi:hypothetical protein
MNYQQSYHKYSAWQTKYIFQVVITMLTAWFKNRYFYAFAQWRIKEQM